jgi:hypothetical protein
MFWLGISALGLAVALLNVWASLQIWRAGVHERPQLLAQTILIWGVPGAAIVVLLALNADRTRNSTNDSTSSNPQSPNADAVNGMTGHGPP